MFRLSELCRSQRGILAPGPFIFQMPHVALPSQVITIHIYFPHDSIPHRLSLSVNQIPQRLSLLTTGYFPPILPE